ncbi:MAG: hypothetical protein ACOX2G_04585 [Bacillota bacterium]|jgi:hypothetical protein
MKEQRNHRIETVKAEDYKRCHVTDLFGGINKHGEVVFELLEDFIEPSERLYLTPDPSKPSALIESRDEGAEVVVTRVRHAQVIVSPQAIPSFIRWLQQRYDEYREAYLNK